MNTTTTKKGFVHHFRAGVHFSERLVKNLIIQIKWIFSFRRKLHRKLLSFHSTPHQSLHFVYGLFVGMIIMIIIIPVFGWAFIKSI
ncbi:MAG: hypothetical protein WCG45_04730 [bacterium]